MFLAFIILHRSNCQLGMCSDGKPERKATTVTPRVVLCVLCSLCAPLARLLALDPAAVVLLVNRNMPDSSSVADHYRVKRGVPKENVIDLDLPKSEDISRRDYDAKIVAPVRAALADRKERVKVLLCIYG